MLRRHVAAAALGATSLVTVLALADRVDARMMIFEEDLVSTPTFELQGGAIGGSQAPDAGTPAHLAGATIALFDGGALVIDGDSGELVQLDKVGKVLGRLAIGSGAAQLVVDRAAARAYVADRAGDRVVVVALGKKLTQAQAIATPAEPWGLALSPDGKTLLVTTIADRTLVAIDTDTGKERWQRGLSREPRGIAYAPDGKSAMVAYLLTGTAERIDLDGAEHAGAHVALAGGTTQSRFGGVAAQPLTGVVVDAAPLRGFARNAFAVRFVGNGLAILGHSQSTPVQIAEGGGGNRGSYGGGFEPPIEHRLVFVGAPDGVKQPMVAARIASHQPNALGWDPATDTLVTAGYGSDDLLVVREASRRSVALTALIPIGAGCGPDGVAVADGQAWVWCSLTRRVARVALDGTQTVAFGPEATRSVRTALAQEGLAIFRSGNDARVSTRGAMACASCHPDGRADGLSWRIEGHTLQTPLLAGRVAGTHPYKWDGADKDLTTSLTATMRRLGGSGIGADEVKALSAYLETLPAPRRPSRNRAQVARGKKLFAGALGCDTCHGGKRFADGERHELATDLKEVDTPSLIAVAASAPYYHDGSAATLEALLRDTALVHGMADTQDLTDPQIADLVAYLETL